MYLIFHQCLIYLYLSLQLKAVIEEHFQANPKGGEQVRDTVQQRVVEVGQEVAEKARTRCTQLTHQHCDGEVESALALLLPPDISPQVALCCQCFAMLIFIVKETSS